MSVTRSVAEVLSEHVTLEVEGIEIIGEKAKATDMISGPVAGPRLPAKELYAGDPTGAVNLDFALPDPR
jgi:hypothetical protein